MQHSLVPILRHSFFPTSLILALLVSLSALAEGYRTTVGTGPDEITLIVAKGTPYEMGYAMGRLMKSEVQAVLKRFLGAVQSSGDSRFADQSLDAAWKAIEPHTDKRFIEEMQGVAEGAGVPLHRVRRAHMIPVVADYACSGVACWGSAARDGHLYQIRNLDYVMQGGLQDYPLIVVYLPQQGIAHVSVTFAGVVASNTGMNAEGIVLSEIGDSPVEDYPFNLHGTHFTSMFRRILYDAKTLNEALGIIRETRRIKKYHYIVGDGSQKRAVKVKAYAPDLVIWTDNDPKDSRAPHVLRDVVYHAEQRDPIAYGHLSVTKANTNRGA